MRVPVGRVDAVPDSECRAIADGQAVVVRVGDELRAFENRCIHQDSPIAGARVRNGVLSCPLHFWRYHVDDGQLIGSRRSLARYPVELVGEEAYVLLPDPDPEIPLRQRLLARAQAYDRDEAFRAEPPTRG
jgi:nitrite reductase/ring-hydroxylating ferredoxin subunit